jgi:predicted kinase
MVFKMDPRWQLDSRNRQHELCKSKILLRHWSHTWQKKSTKKHQNFNTLNSHPVKNFSMPHYTEKTGGLLHHQMPAPNLLGRHSADQQVRK